MDSLDAAGGSFAAALSVAIFYPLERIRVHVQTRNNDENESTESWYNYIVRMSQIDIGMATRLLHTIVTSFVYYRIYRIVLARRINEKRSILGNIFASNAAAMLTVLVATPLEGIVLRHQKKTTSAQISVSVLEQEQNHEQQVEQNESMDWKPARGRRVTFMKLGKTFSRIQKNP